MNPYTPTHRPRKRFGQHFMHDPQVIAHIVAAIGPKPGECVVEIGPGLGALTCPLLERVGALDVVELDHDLIPKLKARCAGLGILHVHEANALMLDFGALTPVQGKLGQNKLRIVGNLPYNISTPLLFHLLDFAPVIHDLHFLLQKEVVERLIAKPGSGQYGRLSVMAQYHCEAVRLFNVGSGAFIPRPKIESALVRLIPRPPAVNVHDKALFDRIVAQAFAKRRKTVRNALKGMLDEASLSRAGIDPELRPERLDLRDFAALADAAATLQL